MVRSVTTELGWNTTSATTFHDQRLWTEYSNCSRLQLGSSENILIIFKLLAYPDKCDNIQLFLVIYYLPNVLLSRPILRVRIIFQSGLWSWRLGSFVITLLWGNHAEWVGGGKGEGNKKRLVAESAIPAFWWTNYNFQILVLDLCG